MDKRNIDNLSPEERFFDTAKIEIDGMTCDECVQTINNALRGADGVKEVHVDRAKRLAIVTYDTRKTHVPALHDILLSHGYHPTRFAEPTR